MEGDLSLSQSLGGLRIANPDEAPTAPINNYTVSTSPVSPISTITPHSTKALHAPSTEDLQPFPVLDLSPPASSPLTASLNESSPYTNPALGAPTSQNSVQESPAYYSSPNRRSVATERGYYHQPQPPNLNASGRTGIGRAHQPSYSNSARPASSMYPQQMSSPPNVVSPGNPGASYRLRSESSRSSMGAYPVRSDSRTGTGQRQVVASPAEQPPAEISYRGSQTAGPGATPLPPRRSSRGMGHGPANGLSQNSSYRADGGRPTSSAEWEDRGATTVIQREIDRSGRSVQKVTKKGVKDFNFGRTLGEGSYSTVLAATDRQTLHEFAIKVLDKRHIIKEKKIKYVTIEKDTLNRLTSHPGIVRLYYTFQDEKSLYYVLDLASGGELLGFLKKMTTFDVECTRYYGAQILDAIDYMHSQGIIHRDLKPENVLLDDQMRVKITDFGTAKILSSPKTRNGLNGPGAPFTSDPVLGSEVQDRAASFVGTAEYVSPELLSDKNACKASDLWAFGCIIYQLLAGRPPFKAANEYLTFQKIVSLDYEFPKGFPAVAQDLVERLLVLDPSKRLSMEHIKNHEFFDGITWGPSLWSQKAPRLRPYVSPATEPKLIKLNGHGNSAPSPNVSTAVSGARPGQIMSSPSRPQPRIITELPPPSQLDIDWSPVLTKVNERILKLGDLSVITGPVSTSPTNNGGETSRKISRFFGSTGIKKRTRLVMVTSSARVIIAAAGGEEKKMKIEIALLTPGTFVRGSSDAKGEPCWCIETKDKTFTFEDIKPTSKELQTSPSSTQDWLDAIERAKAIAASRSAANSYAGDDAFKELTAPSPASTLGGDSAYINDGGFLSSGRISSNPNELDASKSRKRFSKRHSKSGLSAVF